MERERQRGGWGWGEEGSVQVSQGLAGQPQGEKKPRPLNYAAPWESIRQQWIWSKGHWRFGWDTTSVEEWTGPAVWTDSIVS